MKKTALFSRLALVACVLVLGACAQDEPHFPYGQLSPVPPPDTIYEPAPQLESPMTEIWRPGHWTYNGIDFIWTPGMAMARPSATAVWASDRWDQRKYGWAFVPGHWQ